MTARAPSNLGWLLSQFAEDASVAHAVAVSSDGLLLAASGELPGDRAEQLAAIAAGTASMADGSARLLEGGQVVQTIIEMEVGLLFLMSISGGACLAVLAPRGCDVGKIGYEMTLLVDQVGSALAPDARSVG